MLAHQVLDELRGEYQYSPSDGALRADAKNGHRVVYLAGSDKQSPNISISFYFGINFDAARSIELQLERSPRLYHINQYSLNRNLMQELEYRGPYTWLVNVNSSPSDLAAQIAQAVHGIADPFFERFSTLASARDAIAGGSSWCFSGPTFWQPVLLLDIALGDLEHFRNWSLALSDESRVLAEAMLIKHIAAKVGVPNSALEPDGTACRRLN